MVYSWANHETACFNLYVEEGRPLDEVMQIMKEKYDFDPRSVSRLPYKLRLASNTLCATSSMHAAVEALIYGVIIAFHACC